jgi:hypothetical protein
VRGFVAPGRELVLEVGKAVVGEGGSHAGESRRVWSGCQASGLGVTEEQVLSSCGG